MGIPIYNSQAVKHLLKKVDGLIENLDDLGLAQDDNGNDYRDIKLLRRAIRRVKETCKDKGDL